VKVSAETFTLYNDKESQNPSGILTLIKFNQNMQAQQGLHVLIELTLAACNLALCKNSSSANQHVFNLCGNEPVQSFFDLLVAPHAKV
jgi:hypothetical protein